MPFDSDESDNCLWLFPTSVYQEMLDKYDNKTDILTKKDRAFIRRLNNSQPVEIDKAGRIPIPQAYRKEAGLIKDCLVFGLGNLIEIWDMEKYRQYYSDSKDDLFPCRKK